MTEPIKQCRWCEGSDEVCVNADCPLCAGFCPLTDYPGVCRYEDRGDGTDGWIACKDRLPEKDTVVLTTIYGTDLICQQEGETLAEAFKRSLCGPGRVNTSFFSDNGWCDNCFGGPEIVIPTYWMPMPIAPPNPKLDELTDKDFQRMAAVFDAAANDDENG